MSSVRILIADDHDFVRRGLRTLIESRSDWEVCGEAADGQAAVEKARELKPDIALLDVSMPLMNGLDAARLIRTEIPDCQILIVSQNDPEVMEKAAAEVGAKGFVHKSNIARDLLKAIDAAVEITDKELAKRELDKRERASSLLAAIVDSSDDAIVSKSLDGVITSWNHSAERMFGYTSAEAIGKHITLIIPPDRRREEEIFLGKIRRGERVEHFETVRVRKDGTTIDLSLTISPVKDASGKVTGASKVARDISERKLAEEKLQLSQLRLASEAEALRLSEERFRKLSEVLDAEVRARTVELEERNADVLRQSAQLQELSWRLLRIQDEERRHIARELHDSAGQTLTVLGMNLATMVKEAGKSAPEIVESARQTQELVQQLTKEIRTTSYLLHPPLLDEVGLPAALPWYTSGLKERSGLDVVLSISGEFGRLPRDMELVVFRLVQECLNNIHRHSGSKSAVIQISRDSDRVLVEVSDRGKGISPARLAEIQSKGSGVGIRGMRERLRQFQGEMIINSTGDGTTIVVTIPVSKELGTVMAPESLESTEGR